MSTVAVDTKQFFQDYLQALNNKPKTDAVVDQYVSDPSLKEHIREAEAAFPEYEIAPIHIAIDGDLIAMHATLRGVHMGTFAGIAPTGKTVSSEFMIFYRVRDGRIAEHWMQWDARTFIEKLAG
jgi:predicted ester cyclase